jgi:hypothetical protein
MKFPPLKVPGPAKMLTPIAASPPVVVIGVVDSGKTVWDSKVKARGARTVIVLVSLLPRESVTWTCRLPGVVPAVNAPVSARIVPVPDPPLTTL